MLEGILIGMTIATGMMFISTLINNYYYKNTLILKSKGKNRTSEKLGNDFYYIVPADEYLEMEQLALFRKFDEMKREEKIK